MPSNPERAAEMEALRARLAEAEEALRAIRGGEVDGVVVAGGQGEQVYTLRGADRIYRQLIETMSEGAATLSAAGAILYGNARLAEMLGRPLDQVLGTALRNYLPPADQSALDAVLAQVHTAPIRREINLRNSAGHLVPVYLSASRVQSEGAELVFCLVLTDLTEQKSHEQIVAAQKERDKILLWQQGISLIQQALLAPDRLEDKLKNITDSIVRLFGADFCRIWLIRAGDLCERGCIHAEVNEGPHICRYRDRCLHLLASSGRYTHTDGKAHRRVPFDCYKIGRIASGKDHKFITNDVQNDPRVHDHEWACDLGLVSFAGYQLRIPGGETLGVLALFARHPILPAEDALLDGLSSALAQVVQQAEADEALSESEEKQRLILKSMINAFVLFESVFDDDGHFISYRFVLINDAYERITGMKNEEVKGKTVHEVWPETEPEWIKRYGEVAVTGISQTFDMYHAPTKKFYHCNAYRPGNTKNSFCVIFEDITERKRAEEALRENESAQRKLSESLARAQVIGKVGSWETDIATLNVQWSEQTHRIFETTPDTFKPTHAGFVEFIHPDDRKAVSTALMESFDSQAPRSIEHRIVMRDGRIKHVEERWQIFANAENHSARASGTCQDITERKRFDEAVHASEARLRAFCVALPDVALLLDEDGRYVEVLTASEHLLYKGGETLVGKTLPEVFPAGQAAVFMDVIHRTLETGQVQTLEYSMPLEIGLTWFEGRIAPVTSIKSARRMVVFLARNITARKQAENALQESTALLSTLLEAMPTPVFYKDAEGRYIGINKAFEAFYGKTSAELFGKSVFDIAPRELAEVYHAQDLELFRNPGVQVYESQVKDAQGLMRDVVFHKATFKGSGGKVIGLIGVILDITARKRAEEALRASENEFRSLTESIPQIVWITRADGGNIYFNQQWVDYTGLTLEQSCGYGWNTPFHPDDKQRAWEAWQRATQHNDLYSVEARLRRADGTYRWWLVRGVPLRNDRGEILKWFGTCTDIEDIKRAEQELTESKALTEAIVENAPFMIFLKEATDLRFVIFNRAGEELLGYDRKALLGRNNLDLFPPEQAAHFMAKDREVLDGEAGAVDIPEEPMLTAKKGTRLLHTRKICIRGTDGKTKFLLGICEDITDRKRAEEEKTKLETQLRQAQKMEAVGQLAGGVAHDFNNLLMGIMGYADLCREEIGPDHPIRAWLDEITNASQRSADITRQLLAFARKQVIAPRVLDLNDAVAGMLKLLRRLIGEDINLAFLPGADLRPVRVDPSQIDQLLANLCVNARDAIAGVGRITLETGNITLDADYCAGHAEAVAGAYVFLAVSDNGCGMAPDTLAQIFEPFFTTKDIGKGTGLGLATVYGIVKQNNGFIGVDSEPGKGTTFKMYLPQVATEAGKTTDVHMADVPKGRGETILVVEDEKSLREICGRFLEPLGYKVLVAETPGDALKIAEQHPGDIQLLLTDVVMPGMDGRQLAQRLGAVKPGLKVLFMSGYTADVIAQRGVLDQGLAFIAKPFTRDELAHKLREVLKDSK